MFYWDKNDCGFELESHLQTVKNAKEIFVATAYLSIDGVNILQRFIDRCSVNRENITVCLSSEFSDDHPADILTELNKIAMVRIAKAGRLFHPKMYYIKGETEDLLIFGSSNLTGGGFAKNIEFDSIYKPTEDEIKQVDKFIDYCLSNSEKLTESHIRFYRSQEKKLIELKKIKTKILVQLKSFYKKDDPFNEYTYDLTDFYFKFADYEAFFSRNSTLNTPEIMGKRKTVQDKLLAINDIIEEKVKALNLHVHWDRSNITSLTYPCHYNNFHVDWMGVRYGKRKEEILFGGGVKEPYESFTKHACLQFNVYPTGFEIVLFFAVPNGALDRQNLKDKLRKITNEINQQVQNMKGYGLVWRISDCPDFNFDTDNDLATYLKQNDCDGRFSSLNMHFEPDDPRIKTLPNICKQILEGFKLLKPLYDLIVWRPKKI